MAAVVVVRRNPLRTYQFRVAVYKIGDKPGDYVAGVKGVSGLRVQVGAWETWEGGNNLHRYANPNKVTWDPVTLEQGLALDETFERWAVAVLDYATSGKVTKEQPVKREVVIDVWDENLHGGAPTDLPTGALDQFGPRFRRYRLKNAWISKYQPLAKLDSLTSEVALLSVELMHEGWVKEPVQ
jgi:phage tail-like protein